MPYNFSAQSTGLTYLGPFIAAFLAMLLVGPLTDFSARVLSKRNHGIFEPEFRLTPIVLYLFFGILGFVGYGWTLQDGTPWIGPVMFFSISNFGVVMGSTAGISYVIDSHRHSADAALGSLIFWKYVRTVWLEPCRSDHPVWDTGCVCHCCSVDRVCVLDNDPHLDLRQAPQELDLPYSQFRGK